MIFFFPRDRIHKAQAKIEYNGSFESDQVGTTDTDKYWPTVLHVT